MNFQDVVREARMRKARTLLKESGQTVESIAADVGYESVEHFNRLLKSLTGLRLYSSGCRKRKISATDRQLSAETVKKQKTLRVFNKLPAEAQACNNKGEPQPAVKDGDENLRNKPRDAQADAEGHHEGHDAVGLPVEKAVKGL